MRFKPQFSSVKPQETANIPHKDREGTALTAIKTLTFGDLPQENRSLSHGKNTCRTAENRSLNRIKWESGSPIRLYKVIHAQSSRYY